MMILVSLIAPGSFANAVLYVKSSSFNPSTSNSNEFTKHPPKKFYYLSAANRIIVKLRIFKVTCIALYIVLFYVNAAKI